MRHGKHFLFTVQVLAVATLSGTVCIAVLRPDAPGSSAWIPAALFVDAVTTAFLFTTKLVHVFRGAGDASAFGWRSGLSACGVLASLYIVGATLNHWWFFRDDENSGVMDARALGVNDVPCDSMVLARIADECIAYRRPWSIVLGSQLGQPFVADYEEGRSKQLKIAYEKIRATAHKLRLEQ